MILAALGVIVVSVATTLLFSDVLFARLGGQSNSGYNQVTFTDAVVQCQQMVRAEFKTKLSHVVLDDHSSRFDQASNQYRIFFNAQQTKPKSEEDAGYYVSCMVNASTGRITEMEGAETKDSPTEAVRKEDGGMFGWPK